jgi:ABC-2 type transport system ATP-binding protein
MAATVRLERLRKEYYELVAVDDVELQIPSGEIFGLIGPNGAGKTTLMRMLATTLEPTSGRAYLDDVDVIRHPMHMRQRMGFMPDFFQLFPELTVTELLEYFGRAHGMSLEDRRRRGREVLSVVGLEDKASAQVRGLSRGMMQRLGLARAILHQPDVLILDEPASGLDPAARQTLFDALRRCRQEGTTILISSHILTELSPLCTSVGIMNRGRFVEHGRTEEILARIQPGRRLRIQLLSGADRAGRMLAGREGVSDVVAADDGRSVSFTFSGEDPEAAVINADLIGAGLDVVLVEQKKTDLNALYLAVAGKESGE